MAVARKGDAPISRIAKDFGNSKSCLRDWLQRTDVDDSHRPGVTSAESVELRELKRRNRLLEQENRVLRRAAAYLSQTNLPGNDPLVRELAAFAASAMKAWKVSSNKTGGFRAEARGRGLF